MVGVGREVFVVSDDEESSVEFVAQFEKEIVKTLAIGRVKTAGWLVGEYHLGGVDECTSHGTSLTFATGKLRRTMVGSVSEFEASEQSASASESVGFGLTGD